MLTAILDLMGLHVGNSVDLTVEGDRLVVQLQKRPRYTIDELLDQDRSGPGRE
jgi:antitoxin component of MazEF toxin-antitoxin module